MAMCVSSSPVPQFWFARRGLRSWPFAIVGSYECWGRQHGRPQRGNVAVVFGPPIDCSRWCAGDEAADHDRITAELQASVTELLQANGGPSAVASPDRESPPPRD